MRSSSRDLAAVRSYYDETWLDYRLLWLNSGNYAIHFGYWDNATRTHAEALANLNAVLARRLQVRPGETVLDAGCGVGGSAIWLARHCGARVIGITPVASQVDRAQQFARREGVQRLVSFEPEDYVETSFADGSFDVVWAVESLCHAVDKRQFYAEARRLLRPGGRLGIIEYIRRARPLPPAGERLVQSWLSGWAIPDLATATEHGVWAQQAGFTELEIIDITANVRRSLRRLHRMASLAWPAAAVLHRLGLRSATQHGNVRGARAQYRGLRQGLWFDAMLTATARELP